MLIKQQLQATLFEHYVEHEIGTELKNISMILEQHLEILDWVEKDIQTINLKEASGQACEMGVDFEYHDHHRAAKKWARAIIYTKGVIP